MKRVLAIFALFFLPPILSATTTIMGKMQTLGTGNANSGSFMRFWLRGCGGNQPRINGTALIAPTQGGVYYFDIAADSGGNINGTLYSTRDVTGLLGGDIECGGSETSVWYGMQAFTAGKGGPEVPIAAKNTAVLDISNITPITTNPVIVAPTGDSTYARLDAGNQPFTGMVTAPLLNAGTGFRINNLAPSGHFPRGNGTNYIDGTIGFSDLSGSLTCPQMPALTGGDTTSSAGSCVTITPKVDGVSYPSAPSTDTVPVVTAPNTVTYEAVPNASLQNSSTTVNGSACALGGTCTTSTIFCAIVSKTSNYTLGSSDCTIQASTAGGAFTLTIPHAVSGQLWTITRTDASANKLAIAGDSGNVNGQTQLTVPPDATFKCYADGANSWCTGTQAGTTEWGSIAGCVASSGPCTVTLTWPTPFADATYQAICTPVGPETGNPQGAFFYISSQTASQLVIGTDNVGTTHPGGYTSFNCMGHHS